MFCSDWSMGTRSSANHLREKKWEFGGSVPDPGIGKQRGAPQGSLPNPKVKNGCSQ